MYWITGLLGAVLLASPFLFGYNNNVAALWASVIIGGLVAIASVFEALEAGKDKLEYWIALGLGAVAIIVPFAFGFMDQVAATWASILIGLAVVVASSAKLLQQPGQVKPIMR